MKKILFVMLCLLLPLSVSAYSSADNSHYITQDKYVEENKKEEKRDYGAGILFLLSMTISGIVLATKRNKILDILLLLLNIFLYMNDLSLLFLLLGSISFLIFFIATTYFNKEMQKYRLKQEMLPKLAKEKFKLVTQTNFEGRRILYLPGGSSSGISSSYDSSSDIGGGSYSCVRYGGGGGHSSGGGSTRGF